MAVNCIVTSQTRGFRTQVLDGTIKVIADDWPTFLYEEGVYDPGEIDKGLLRGHFLLRVSRLFIVHRVFAEDIVAKVYKHIFTSPSSALKDSPGTNATRSGNAKIHHMTRVTPTTIAYAAVQVSP
jgi:hypothetical protein